VDINKKGHRSSASHICY